MHGAPDTVFDRSNCGSGVVRWCAHHLLQLGPPWGTGAMPPHPRNNRTLLDDLGGPHTLHQDHIWRCRHRIRPFELRGSNRVSRTVVRRWCALHLQHLGLGPPWGIWGNASRSQGGTREGRKLLGHLGGPRAAYPAMKCNDTMKCNETIVKCNDTP